MASRAGATAGTAKCSFTPVVRAHAQARVEHTTAQEAGIIAFFSTAPTTDKLAGSTVVSARAYSFPVTPLPDSARRAGNTMGRVPITTRFALTGKPRPPTDPEALSDSFYPGLLVIRKPMTTFSRLMGAAMRSLSWRQAVFNSAGLILRRSDRTSLVMADVGNGQFPDRIRAGTGGNTGGIRTGDS
jgi:hypothetical protein